MTSVISSKMSISRTGTLPTSVLQLGTSQRNIKAVFQQPPPRPSAHTVAAQRRGMASCTPAVAGKGAAAPSNEATVPCNGASTPHWDESIFPHWQCSLRTTSPCLSHLCPPHILSHSRVHKCVRINRLLFPQLENVVVGPPTWTARPPGLQSQEGDSNSMDRLVPQHPKCLGSSETPWPSIWHPELLPPGRYHCFREPLSRMFVGLSLGSQTAVRPFCGI